MMVTTAGFARVAGHSSALYCLRNMQILSSAWTMYANDNQGLLVPNPDGSDSGKVPTKPAWSGGWLDFTASSDNTNVNLLMGLENSYGGLLGAYLVDSRVYKCPEDLSKTIINHNPFPRTRSVSMNPYLSAVQTANGNRLNTWASPRFQPFMRRSDFLNLSPSECFSFIEENSAGINDGNLAVDLQKVMDQYGNLTPSNYTLIDYPGAFHENGAALSFVDGHAEVWVWKDSRTNPALKENTSINLGFSSTNNPDVERIGLATSRSK